VGIELMAGGARLKAWIIGGLFAALLCGLLLLHAGDPWRFPNEDNGAWFSAVARSHVQAGLRATRGQDFFQSRESGELVPYLHHPPMPGLILAAVFGLLGRDSPGIARVTFALLHLLTFALLAGIAARLWNPVQESAPYAYALAAAASVPMSAYYGKMPNHEVPGLLFFLLGVFIWRLGPAPPTRRRLILACCAWTLAAFTSWHAVLCIFGWLAMQLGGERRRSATIALGAVAAAATLVVVQLFWAGNWALQASQAASTKYWFIGSDGASLLERLGFLQHALSIGIERYGYLPALLSLAWLVQLVADRARGRRGLTTQERNLVGLLLGSLVYYLLFPRAVSFHAYQGFYVLPFVALTASLSLQRLLHSDFVRARARLSRWLPPFMVGLTCVLGIAATVMLYRKPSPRVLEVVQSLERQYR
jgi:hypothetical protein